MNKKQLQALLKKNPELGVIEGDAVIPAKEYVKPQKSRKKASEPVYGKRTEPITITLDGERPISWNVLYAGGHWNIRKREADRAHALVQEQVQGISEYFKGPVHITTTVYFDANPFDSCNIPDKIYIDGLKGYLIHDDDLKYVASNTRIPAMDYARPRVEIHIELA